VSEFINICIVLNLFDKCSTGVTLKSDGTTGRTTGQ